MTKSHAVMPECRNLTAKGHLWWSWFAFIWNILNLEFVSSLKEAEKPFCERLHRVRDLMDRSKVSIEEVISELGQYLISTFDGHFYHLNFLSLFNFFFLKEGSFPTIKPGLYAYKYFFLSHFPKFQVGVLVKY